SFSELSVPVEIVRYMSERRIRFLVARMRTAGNRISNVSRTGLECCREIDSGGEMRIVLVVGNHYGRTRTEVVYRNIVREETPAVAQNRIVIILARDGMYGRHVVKHAPVYDIRLHIAQRFGRIRGERVAVN